MTVNNDVGNESRLARERMLRHERRPMFLCDWLSALFIHFEVDARLLQPEIPYALDCRNGRAYASIVAFTMKGLRPVVGGRLAAAALRPIATHGFLNVRTYVTHAGEPGIYFIREWLPNRLSVLLGPTVFGLPYRHGKLEYDHQPLAGYWRDQATAADGSGVLRYSARAGTPPAYRPCHPGSLDHFLLERYTAYTHRGLTLLNFRVWHEPWPQIPITARLEDERLLVNHFRWYPKARQVAANYSAGVRRVWIGRPHRIRAARPAIEGAAVQGGNHVCA